MFNKLGRMRSSRQMIKSDPRFAKLLTSFESLVKSHPYDWLTVQSIANVFHALGVMGVSSSVMLQCLDDNKYRIIKEGKPHAISNCIYSLARLSSPTHPLISTVTQPSVARKVFDRGNPQDVSNIVWSLAAMGLEDDVWGRELEKGRNVEMIVREGNAQEIANTLWGMATMSCPVPNLSSAINRKSVVSKIVGNTPQDASNTIWSMAIMDQKAPNLATALNKPRVVSEIFAKRANMQELSNTLWAMSRLKYDCEGIVKVMEERKEEIRDDTSQGIANVAFGLAFLGYFNSSIFHTISRHCPTVANGKTQAVTNTLWAFGVAGMVREHEEAVRMLWDEAMRRPISEFIDETWRQLEIARLYAKGEGVRLEILDDEWRGWKRTELMKEAVGISREEETKFHREIVKDLERFGFQGFGIEASPFEDGEGGKLLTIDIAWKEEKVALELDGQYHFLSPSKRWDGPTKAKKKLLESLGWKVLNMSHFDYIKYKKLNDEDRMMLWTELGEMMGIPLPI